MGTNREFLNRANPGTVYGGLQAIAFGDLLAGQVPGVARQINMVGRNGQNNLATLHSYKGAAPANVIHRAYARAGGVTGELTRVAYGATPATTQIAVAPNGNIVTLAADAITDLDVVYTPERGDVVEVIVAVVANSISLAAFTQSAKAVLLLEVEALAGTVQGKKVVLIPGAGAPAAGQARLNLAKTAVAFAAADGVTRARLKLLVDAAADLTSFLTAADEIYQ